MINVTAYFSNNLSIKDMKREYAVIICNGIMYKGSSHYELLEMDGMDSDLYPLDIFSDGMISYIIAYSLKGFEELNKVINLEEKASYKIGVYTDLGTGEFMLVG